MEFRFSDRICLTRLCSWRPFFATFPSLLYYFIQRRGFLLSFCRDKKIVVFKAFISLMAERGSRVEETREVQVLLISEYRLSLLLYQNTPSIL